MTTSLFVWGMVQSFLMGTILLTVKHTRYNRLLSSIFLAISVNILFQYLLRFTLLKHDVPQLLVVPDCLDLLLPTLLFLYIKDTVNKAAGKKDLVFFLVPVSWSLVLLTYVAIHQNFEFASFIGTTVHWISLWVIVVWKLLLFVIALFYLKKTKRPLRKKQRVPFFWPRTLLVFLGLITYISLCNLVFFFFKHIGSGLGDSVFIIGRAITLNYILFTCFILFMSVYFFVSTSSVFTKPPLGENNRESVDAPQLEAILEAVDTQKLYLDPRLSIRSLSEQLDVPFYTLSKLLNEHVGKSFNEFINEKRVAEAQRLLELPENKESTIYAIAVESGFKSESGFYSNFKKFTSVTPNQYKKQVRQKETA